MSTELWFVHPQKLIKHLVELGQTRVIFKDSHTRWQRIEAYRFCDLHYPANMNWRCIFLDSNLGLAHEFTRESTIEHCDQMHWFWEYGRRPIKELKRMLKTPTIEGQAEHRVLVRFQTNSSLTRSAFFSQLQELQLDHPEVKIHILNDSFATAFGKGCAAAGVNLHRRRGAVWLPTGKYIQSNEMDELLPRWRPWVNMLGYELGTLINNPEKRYGFNVRSAIWAAEHWDDSFEFYRKQTFNKHTGDRIEPLPPELVGDVDLPYVPASPKVPTLKGHVEDKVLCDSCSLQNKCGSYRRGSVCRLPDSYGHELAEHFKTTDADQVIRGLGDLMAMQIERAEQGRETEQVTGELDPHVTKIIDGLFTKGATLAKILRPPERGPLVQVGIANGVVSPAIGDGAPSEAQLAASAMQKLEAAGWERGDITEEAVIETIERGHPPKPSLSLTAARSNDDGDAPADLSDVLDEVMDAELVDP